MASIGSQMHDHVYIIILLKISEIVNGIAGTLFGHYGETNDALLIGGLVEPSEPLMPCHSPLSTVIQVMP
jgi:hypothetical protein